ncbi:MAG: hypothetical protein GY777_29050 [Candidatus Brocadiaceae bacterium]|nr:hypothetical protein [Candidatus Brocadiaceae bacterium]
MNKKIRYNQFMVFLICFGLALIIIGCSSNNKVSRVGKTVGTSAKKNAPNVTAGALRGATTTAIRGGKVLKEGARQGVAPSAGNTAGSTAGAIVREILK